MLACSALRESYRRILAGGGETALVYLKAKPDLLQQRLAERHGHYMPADLLESQFETLEEPQDALVLDASLPPGQIVAAIRAGLQL